MCEAWGIRHLVGSSRHPQSQGQVEATNKLIEERLRRSMSAGVEWDVLLPKAVYDINHRVVGSTKISKPGRYRLWIRPAEITPGDQLMRLQKVTLTRKGAY